MKMHINKKWKLFIVIAITIIFIIAIHAIKQINIKKEIIAGYSEIIDIVLDEYLAGTGLDRWGNIRENEYAIKTELNEIAYEIVEITAEEGLYRGNHDDTYVLNVVVYLTCTDEISNSDKQKLADEVFWTFYDIQSVAYGIEIGDYKCSYYPTDDSDYAYKDLITIYVNGDKIIYPHRRETNNTNESNLVKCRRSGCGKEAVHEEWDRRYCSENIRETHYCRYPGCTNQIPNSSTKQYCYNHD